MRNGQNKRMRGRNRKGGHHHHHNPLTRVYESNGPDVKIRGTANHVAEKYLQLARDAQGSGDPVAAENYYQHAEHYFRLIAAAQEQFRQTQPYRQEGGEQGQQARGDDNFEDGEEDMQGGGNGEPHYPREMREQPYPREGQQPYPQQNREQQAQHRQHDNRPQDQNPGNSDVDRLPSFITGGQPQQTQGHGQNNPGQNGYDQQDRFSHRRRRRGYRGARPDMPGSAQGMSGDGGDDNAPPTAPSGE